MTTMELSTPLKKSDVKHLKIWDDVRISGIVYTARDEAHKYLLKREFKENLEGAIVYHCGPIVRNFEVVSAGPTTSWRMSAYVPALLEKYGIKAIIGKGGMDDETRKALEKSGAVYLSAVGGAGAFLAKCVLNVEDVFMLEEFGETEAIWKLRVEGFPAIVGMDSHGGDVYRDVELISRKRLMNVL